MEEKEILQAILSEVSGIKSEITGLKSEVGDLKSEMNGLKSEVKELSVRQQHTEDAVQQLRTDMNHRFDTLEEDIGKVLISITDETSAVIEQKKRKLELLKK